MKRRAFVTLVGAGSTALLAGCTGDSDDAPSDDPDDGATSEGGADESTTEGGTGDDPLAGDPDVVMDDPDVTIDGLHSSVETTVENRGDGRSPAVLLYLHWLDEDGEEIEPELADEVMMLEPGDTWSVEFGTSFVDHEEIADADLRMEIQEGPPDPPSGLTVVDSELDLEGATVEVTVENDRDEALESVFAAIRLFDEDGVLVEDAWESEHDLAAGEDWEFSTWPGPVDEDRVADHEVLLERNPWRSPD